MRHFKNQNRSWEPGFALIYLHQRFLRQTASWRLTVANQRDEIQDLLEQNPSICHKIDKKMEKAYVRARRQAAIETGLDEGSFPAVCPLTIEQVLDPDCWLEGR